MNKVKLIFIIIVLLFIMIIACKALQIKEPCTVSKVEGNVVTFVRQWDGNAYEWETDDARKYHKGEVFEVYFCDFEDTNPYNDIIQGIGKEVVK